LLALLHSHHAALVELEHSEEIHNLYRNRRIIVHQIVELDPFLIANTSVNRLDETLNWNRFCSDVLGFEQKRLSPRNRRRSKLGKVGKLHPLEVVGHDISKLDTRSYQAGESIRFILIAEFKIRRCILELLVREQALDQDVASLARRKRCDILINDPLPRNSAVRRDHLRLLADIRLDPYNADLNRRRTALAERDGWHSICREELRQGATCNLTRTEACALYAAGYRSFVVQGNQFRNEMTLLWDIFACTLDYSPELCNKSALVASAIMGGVVWVCHSFLFRILSAGHSAYGANAIATVVSICAGVAVYGVLVIVLRILRAEDVRSMPKGEKLARLLHLK